MRSCDHDGFEEGYRPYDPEAEKAAQRRRTPLAANTAAALAVNAAPQAGNIIDGARAAVTRTGYTTSYAALCMLMESEIRALCAEISRLMGRDATPAPGCQILHSYFGAAPVTVEYEYEAGSRGGQFEPPEPATVTILRVYINGCWCDAEDVASEKTRQRWADEVEEHRAEEAQCAAESDAEARREDRALEWVTL